MDGSPPGSPVPGILQARILEWVAISFSNAWKWKVKVKSLSHVQLLATPWTAAYQAPPSMGFSRQEFWSGCHCLLESRCRPPQPRSSQGALWLRTHSMRVVVLVLGGIPDSLHFPTERADNSSHLMRLSFFVCLFVLHYSFFFCNFKNIFCIGV